MTSNRQNSARWRGLIPVLTGGVLAFLFLWMIGSLTCDSRVEETWSSRLERNVTAPGQVVRWRSEGWAKTEVGKEGIVGVAEESQFSDSAVLLWGDSFVEAFQVRDEEKMAQVATGLFREAGKDLTVFGIGASGQMIADYVLAISAYEKLFPKTRVHVIFLSDIRDMLPDQPNQDRARFISAPEPVIIPDPRAGKKAAPGTVTKLLNKYHLNIVSRGKRKLGQAFSDLRFRPGPVARSEEGPAVVGKAAPGDFKFIVTALRESTEKPILVLYAPAVPSMEDGEIVVEEPDVDLVSACSAALAEAGIRMVNLGPQLEESYEEGRGFARGFANTYPGQGHLNEQGHRLVGEAIVREILKKRDAVHPD